MSPPNPNANEELPHSGSGEKDVAELAITDVDVKPAQVRDDVYDHAERIAYTPEEGARVLRKIDLILLPLLCGCYIFSVGAATLTLPRESVQSEYSQRLLHICCSSPRLESGVGYSPVFMFPRQIANTVLYLLPTLVVPRQNLAQLQLDLRPSNRPPPHRFHVQLDREVSDTVQ
jgi:hypothetical protein